VRQTNTRAESPSTVLRLLPRADGEVVMDLTRRAGGGTVRTLCATDVR